MQDMLIDCKTGSDNMSQLPPSDLYKKLKMKRLTEGVFRRQSLICYVLMTTQREEAGRCFPLILNQKKVTLMVVSGKLDMCLLKREDSREDIYLMPEKSKIKRPWLEVLLTGSRVTSSGCTPGTELHVH